jgi:hypothetical protein
MTIYGHMFDSASQTFPAHSQLNAYYFNGHFNHTPVMYGRGKVWIDVTGAAPKACSWLDVERGDASPGRVPGWLDERDMPGNQGIYCDRSNVGAVIKAAGNRVYNLWISTLDGNTNPVIPSGPGKLVAVQAFPASMVGFNADMSVIVSETYWKRHALNP